jgi:aryl-alcohol dehydrogenase
LALELGATHSFDGADPDLANLIKNVTGGANGGVNYSFETTGLPSVVLTALAVLRPRGFCGMVGVSGSDIVLPAQALGSGRAMSYLLEGSAVPQVFIPQMIDLWQQGRFPFDRLITTYTLEEINEANADSLSGKTIKPVLIPARSA